MKQFLKRKILRGSFYSALEVFITTIFQAGGTFVTLYLLSPEQYGKVVLWLSIHGVASFFLDLGSRNLFIVEIAQKRGEGNWDNARFLLFRYFVIVIGSGTFLLFCFSLWGIYRSALASVIIGLYLFARGLHHIAFCSLNSYTLYREQSIFLAMEPFSRFLLLLIIRFFVNGNYILYILLSYPLSVFLAICVIILCLRNQMISFLARPRLKVSLNNIWRQLRYILIRTPIKRVADQSPFWILNFFLDKEAVGIYAAAQRLTSIIYSFQQRAELLILPLFSQYSTEDVVLRNALFRKTQKVLLAASGLAILLSWLLAPVIFRYVLPHKYMASMKVFYFYVLNLLPTAFINIYRPFLFSLAMQKELTLILSISSVVGVLFMIGLVNMISITGVALGVILGRLVNVFLSYKYSQSVLNIKHESKNEAL